MKNFNLKSILSIIIISLFISVMFVYADWTPPPAGAPTCPASEPGCNAPLNVGSGAQLKTGSLSVNGILQSMSALCIGNDCKTSWPSISCNWGGNVNSGGLNFNCSGSTSETRANYWNKCERGGTRFDSCNGDSNNKYSCLAGENRTCHDEWGIEGCGSRETRWGQEDVTCVSIAGIITSITK